MSNPACRAPLEVLTSPISGSSPSHTPLGCCNIRSSPHVSAEAVRRDRGPNPIRQNRPPRCRRRSGEREQRNPSPDATPPEAANQAQRSCGYGSASPWSRTETADRGGTTSRPVWPRRLRDPPAQRDTADTTDLMLDSALHRRGPIRRQPCSTQRLIVRRLVAIVLRNRVRISGSNGLRGPRASVSMRRCRRVRPDPKGSHVAC